MTEALKNSIATSADNADDAHEAAKNADRRVRDLEYQLADARATRREAVAGAVGQGVPVLHLARSLRRHRTDIRRWIAEYHQDSPVRPRLIPPDDESSVTST